MVKAEKGRKRGDFVLRTLDKLPEGLRSCFPGFALTWQLLPQHFPLFLLHTILPSTLFLGPPLAAVWPHSRHRLEAHMTPFVLWRHR